MSETSPREHDDVVASEALFRLLAENAPDIVARLNIDGTIEWVSPSVSRSLGWQPENLVGHPPQEFVHPDDVATAFDALAEGPTPAGLTRQYRIRLRRSDGSYTWSSAAGHHATEDRLVVSFRIIDDQVMAEQAVIESEARHRMLAENAADVVYMTDTDKRVTWVVPSDTVSLGWTPDELIGTLMVDLIHPDDVTPASAMRDDVYSGRATSDELGAHAARTRLKDGRYRWMSARVTILRDDEGTVTGAVWSLRDVDELIRARQFLEAVQDSMLDPHVVLEPVRDHTDATIDFTVVQANQAACDDYELTRAELIGSRLRDLMPPRSAGDLVSRYSQVLVTGDPLVLDDATYETGAYQGSRQRHYDVRATRVGESVSATWRDVTERSASTRALAESEERYRLLATNATDVVAHARDGLLVWVSPSLTRTLGWQPEQWIGRRFDQVAHPDDRPRVLEGYSQILYGESRVSRLRIEASDGTYHWVAAHVSPFIGADGETDGIAASFRVIDDEVEAEAELDRRARFDSLTGLLNREEVLGRIARIPTFQPRTGQQTAVLFCDIDKLKVINDTMGGHLVGDEVLRTVSARISATIRADDLAGRIGGDEILVVLQGVQDLDNALELAEAIRRSVAEPIPVPGGRVSTTVSIGVTMVTPGDTVDQIMERSDSAMFKDKRQGGNRVTAIGQ